MATIVHVVVSNRWFLKKDETIIFEKKDRESQILKKVFSFRLEDTR